ncbi:hypothetical protein ABW20_dc0100127 [Dactylellina cionopaga]|nr:hypothetical protein ABW20_dc0100127 [Dactylellina cionopaga]
MPGLLLKRSDYEAAAAAKGYNKRERAIGPREWQMYKKSFVRYYVDEKLPLAKCMDIMKNKHKFIASRRQYLAKVREWDIDKNVKTAEMKAAVRKTLQRWADEGKDTVIQVRGVDISKDKLKRFLRREASKASGPDEQISRQNGGFGRGNSCGISRNDCPNVTNSSYDSLESYWDSFWDDITSGYKIPEWFGAAGKSTYPLGRCY